LQLGLQLGLRFFYESRLWFTLGLGWPMVQEMTVHDLSVPEDNGKQLGFSGSGTDGAGSVAPRTDSPGFGSPESDSPESVVIPRILQKIC
jgi:hypothetical protein